MAAQKAPGAVASDKADMGVFAPEVKVILLRRNMGNRNICPVNPVAGRDFL